LHYQIVADKNLVIDPNLYRSYKDQGIDKKPQRRRKVIGGRR